MIGMRLAVLAAGGAGVCAVAKKAAEIDAMKHDIQQLYKKNFDSVISTTRPLTVSSVLYFKGSSRTDGALIDGEYNDLAKKMKKMLKIAAFDCELAPKHCDNLGVKDTPHVHIYPQTPRPHFKFEGPLTADAILKTLYKLIPADKVTILTELAPFNDFKKKGVTKPKLVLFSDKKKPPSMWKALSTDSVFARTVDFAYVGPEGAAVAADVGVKKKLPAVLMILKGKNNWYKEKDISFVALHEWINVNSESGMGDTVKGVDGLSEVAAEEPEYEKVRELHAKSQHELCFKQKNVCGIYLSHGKLEDKAAEMVNDFESKFDPKSDRAVKYSWMWLDVAQESEFKKTIEDQEAQQAAREGREVEPFKYPTMIFVKPPKKKREEKLLSYVRMESGKQVNSASVGDMIERIGGGATYIRADLPKFTVRAKPVKGKKEEL